MAWPAVVLVALICRFGFVQAGAAEFLGRYLVGEDGQQCVLDGKACEDSVDCCGVCAYIGASTWTCIACTAVGDECIPMGNRCCDGGNKQKDVIAPDARHSCKPTDEISELYGVTKNTCQAASAVPEGRTASLLMATGAVTSNVLLQGGATTAQADDLRNFAFDCFAQNPVDTSSLGQLQASMGQATSCVLKRCEEIWGWRPFVSRSGSNAGGPYDAYGSGTIVGVETPSGSWLFEVDMTQHEKAASTAATAMGLHKGDATDTQLADLVAFSQDCFAENPIDVSNVGSLEGSLGTAAGCVSSKCESKWGWKPFLSGEGSNTGGPYDIYGLGATIIGVDVNGMSWQLIFRLQS